MSRYILTRLLWIFPSLILVSFIAFFIQQAIPDDPVLPFLDEDRFGQTDQSFWQAAKTYERTAHQLGIDLPPFYIALQSAILPDTLYKILAPNQKQSFKKLAYQTGNWKDVQNYRERLYALLIAVRQAEKTGSESNASSQRRISNEAEYLLETSSHQEIVKHMNEILSSSNSAPEGIQQAINEVQAAQGKLSFGKPSLRSYLPKVVWHGSKNQYHRWLTGALSGDFGQSIRDRKPVVYKIGGALKWTMIINCFALLLAFGIAIPVGVWSARNRGSKKERWVQKSLFVLFAIPSFWLATILVSSITTDQYATWLDWFPTQGLGRYRDAGNIFQRWAIIAYHLTLPIICLVLGALAYIARQMRQSMSQELSNPYVLFFKSFGLPDKEVVWSQAFRNALFPMITIFGAAIPALFSGSLIIEVIFNIPGMGRLMYDSILSHDWNVVIASLLLISTITVISYLLTDLLYQYFDPRLRHSFTHKNMKI